MQTLGARKKEVVTEQVSFAPNQWIHQGAKLVTSADDVIRELPTSIRAALVEAEGLESEQRNLLAIDSLNQTEQRIYQAFSTGAPRSIDEIVETTGLNSSEVPATLFELEMKASSGNCRESGMRGSSCKCRKALALPARCIRGSASRIRVWSPLT
jgi:predicted Rossmann fold nucleotide-binding protein DprA/Smf involved in DNA uptake